MHFVIPSNIRRSNRAPGAVLLLGLTLAAGCTTNPYTGQQQPSKVAIGAAAGALLGAATSSKGDRKKGVLLGAALGGGAGLYMDQQEAKLRERLAGTGVSVVRDGDQIRLVMPSNVTFGADRSDIQAGFYQVLASVAKVFDEFKNTQVQISGHTDSQGSDEYNLRLSEQRAGSVANFLMTQGVGAERIQTYGYGERYPVASNATAAGRAANRRVTIEIAPKD